MTEAAKARYLKALEKGHTRTAAASVAGVSYDSVGRLCRNDPDFVQACLNAESVAEDAALTTVMDSILKDGNVPAAQWWLERRRPQQYGRQERLMVLRALGTEVAGLGDEELRALAYGAADGGQDALGEGEVIDVEATVQEAQE